MTSISCRMKSYWLSLAQGTWLATMLCTSTNAGLHSIVEKWKLEQNKKDDLHTEIMSNLSKCIKKTNCLQKTIEWWKCLKSVTYTMPNFMNSESNKVHLTFMLTRLNDIMSINSDLSDRTLECDVVFALKEDIDPALKAASARQSEDDVVLSKEPSILSHKMFKNETSFGGTFDEHCQEWYLPALL